MANSPYHLPALRAALTRAKRSGDARKIIAACDAAFAAFDAYGWPDCWATWQVARDDARFQLAREGWSA